MENKYSKTVFYKIVCKDINIKDVYVGHTTDFKIRLTNHRYSCCNPNDAKYNFKVYKFIRENGGWDNFRMVLIEERNLDNKTQAEAHEGYLVNILEAMLNSLTPGRTLKQYKEQNREYLLQKGREYQVKNKEHLLQKHICVCGGLFCRKHKSRHEKTQRHLSYIESIKND